MAAGFCPSCVLRVRDRVGAPLAFCSSGMAYLRNGCSGRDEFRFSRLAGPSACHRRTFGQRVTARRLHGAQMAEQVGGAVLGLQEVVALVRHEPFDERPDPPAGYANTGLLSPGSGGGRPVAGRAGERRGAGRCRGKIDAMDPGDLRPAPARHRLAGDRRYGEKGGEVEHLVAARDARTRQRGDVVLDHVQEAGGERGVMVPPPTPRNPPVG